LEEIVTLQAKTAPKLATRLEEKLPQGFTVFTLPAAHRQRLRTPKCTGTRQPGTQTPHPRRPRLSQ